MSVFPEEPAQLGLRLAKMAWQSILVVGLCSLVVGVLALVWPAATLLVVGALFGIYLLVSGVLQIIAAFGTHTAVALRVLAFVSGALSILLGLLCFRGEMQSILLLGLWIGIGWLFRGVTEITASAVDRDMPARGWRIFLGVLTALGGVVLIVSPLASVALLVLFGGIWLVVVGVVEIITAFRIRSAAKRVAST
ncbi:HdeD family acid-resistance protein [Saccharopolyspora sp. WRP15-2]|uniref:HdeD family acid-resistance protein n=1 Tax=Saccharopolyspora oryzae TaxID=2997343 RepID=A0ABT4V284_9PSEU|nr:HdeD family acid-resistance protein [Saccharopolyspora oryzae]MDA3628069.1 HdeD family acid-resistance protein [Saccharopolyspora oryzae]